MLSGGPPHRGQGLVVNVLVCCDMEIGLVFVVFLTAVDGILSSDLPGNFGGPWEFQHLLLKCLHCWLLAAGFVLRYEQQDCSIFMGNSKKTRYGASNSTGEGRGGLLYAAFSSG